MARRSNIKTRVRYRRDAWGVSVLIVAVETRETIAFCRVSCSGYLSSVRVESAYQGQGFGNRLLRAACNNRYFKATFLECAPYGDHQLTTFQTMLFYRKHGFVPVAGEESAVAYAVAGFKPIIRMFRLGYWKPVLGASR